MLLSGFKWHCNSVPLTFCFAQLAKGKSLGRSKPATKSQIQALATHCVCAAKAIFYCPSCTQYSWRNYEVYYADTEEQDGHISKPSTFRQGGFSYYFLFT